MYWRLRVRLRDGDDSPKLAGGGGCAARRGGDARRTKRDDTDPSLASLLSPTLFFHHLLPSRRRRRVGRAEQLLDGLVPVIASSLFGVSVVCRCGVEREEASSLWRHYGVLVVSVGVATLWRQCGVSLSRELSSARALAVVIARGGARRDRWPASSLALRRWSRVAAARASPPLAARAWAGCVSPPTAEARARARARSLEREREKGGRGRLHSPSVV